MVRALRPTSAAGRGGRFEVGMGYQPTAERRALATEAAVWAAVMARAMHSMCSSMHSTHSNTSAPSGLASSGL